MLDSYQPNRGLSYVRNPNYSSRDCRTSIIDAVYEGVGVLNPAVPAALMEWSIPMDSLGEGARYYRHDPAEAKRLLAAAGYPNGFPASMCFATYGSTLLVDMMQLVVKDLKNVGIEARLDTKEYGAYISNAEPARRRGPARRRSSPRVSEASPCGSGPDPGRCSQSNRSAPRPPRSRRLCDNPRR